MCRNIKKKKVIAHTKYESIAKFDRKITMEKLNEEDKTKFTELVRRFDVEELKPDDNWKSLDRIRNDLCK